MNNPLFKPDKTTLTKAGQDEFEGVMDDMEEVFEANKGFLLAWQVRQLATGKKMQSRQVAVALIAALIASIKDAPEQ